MAALFDLEINLMGTPGELAAVARALTTIGRIAYAGEQMPLTGNDAGRSRQYLRVQVATASLATPTNRRPANRTTPDDTGTLIDLDQHRRDRSAGSVT